jgi:hypothetical protein
MQVEMQAMEMMTVPELQEAGIEIRCNIVRDSDKLHCKQSACNYQYRMESDFHGFECKGK